MDSNANSVNGSNNSKPSILLSTACSPFPTYGFDEPIMDVFTNRLTKGQDIFTSTGHFHFPPLHTIAQNLRAPSVVLEAPTFEMFEKELTRGDYEFLGITCNIVHMEKIFKMCRLVRRVSPDTKIILGGYGIQCLTEEFESDDELREIADYISHGEGIAFMRRLLGEPEDEPIMESHPTCSTVPRYVQWARESGLFGDESDQNTQRRQGGLSFLTSGVGCPNLCEFCSTSHFFQGKYIEISDAATLYEGLKRNAQQGAGQTMIFDEDFFQPEKRAKVEELGRLIRKDEEYGLNGSLGYFTFGSIESLSQFTPEELLLNGLQTVWIGVESLFCDLKKRQGRDVEEMFANLHNAGISTVGSWIAGWDYHDRQNIIEDREFFISLRPCQTQISQLLPIPETALWDRLKEEGRLFDDVPWQDFHFYGGAYRFKNFRRNELLFFIEDMHEKLYEYAGPTGGRIFEVNMNGYEFCMRSNHPQLREQMAERFKRMSSELSAIVPTIIAFAPNGFVRRHYKNQMERYLDLFGPQDENQKARGEMLLQIAAGYKKDQTSLPPKGRPEMEILPKRYEYANDTHELIMRNERPFCVTYPTLEETAVD